MGSPQIRRNSWTCRLLFLEILGKSWKSLEMTCDVLPMVANTFPLAANTFPMAVNIFPMAANTCPMAAKTFFAGAFCGYPLLFPLDPHPCRHREHPTAPPPSSLPLSPQGRRQGGGRGGLYKKGDSGIRKSGRRAVHFSPRTGWRGLVFGGENVTDPYLSRPRLPTPHNTPAWGP